MSGKQSMGNRLSTVILTTAVVVGIDQATKYWAWLTLRGEPMQRFFNDTLRLSFHENPGAFLSMGANLPEFWRKFFFVGLTSVFLLYLLYFVLTEDGFSKLGIFCGSLMFAGGVGNLIDRIFFENGVIDFLNIGIGGIRTGVFNVADMAIMVGVFGLLFFGRASIDDEPDQLDEAEDNMVEEINEVAIEEVEHDTEIESAD